MLKEIWNLHKQLSIRKKLDRESYFITQSAWLVELPLVISQLQLPSEVHQLQALILHSARQLHSSWFTDLERCNSAQVVTASHNYLNKAYFCKAFLGHLSTQFRGWRISIQTQETLNICQPVLWSRGLKHIVLETGPTDLNGTSSQRTILRTTKNSENCPSVKPFAPIVMNALEKLRNQD